MQYIEKVPELSNGHKDIRGKSFICHNFAADNFYEVSCIFT
jgi:hypothetical protein